jgi:hypothetical protein
MIFKNRFLRAMVLFITMLWMIGSVVVVCMFAKATVAAIIVSLFALAAISAMASEFITRRE